MKNLLLSTLFVFTLAASAHASPQTNFIDKVWKAVESKQAASFMSLYDQAPPKSLEPVFSQQWQNLITQGIASVTLQPMKPDNIKQETQPVTVGDTTYIRSSKPSVYLILTLKSENTTMGRFPVSVIDGKYYLTGWKTQ